MPYLIFSALKDDKKQAIADYSLILALATVVAMGALAFLGGYVSTTLVNVAAAY